MGWIQYDKVDVKISENERNLMLRLVFDITCQISLVKRIIEEEAVCKMVCPILRIHPKLYIVGF
ncbi:hypothetical protein BOVMAS02_08750 [Streptococcus uberis]|uniref:hypothetical protein n=1 Tax=Streptococcus uberis TaxID=1349 RepID=UPI0012D465EE|nr:hypothetical protein [Streptococcus uberis]MCK1227021.1 hypothetical protein [Streptococcus uberis]